MPDVSFVRVTDRLIEVEIDHITRGKSVQTLCTECLKTQSQAVVFIQRVELTNNTPHTSCNRCGAITTDDYAKRFS